MDALITTAKALAGFGDRDPGAIQAEPIAFGLVLLVIGTIAIAYAWWRMRSPAPVVSRRSPAPRPRPETVGAGRGV